LAKIINHFHIFFLFGRHAVNSPPSLTIFHFQEVLSAIQRLQMSSGSRFTLISGFRYTPRPELGHREVSCQIRAKNFILRSRLSSCKCSMWLRQAVQHLSHYFDFASYLSGVNFPLFFINAP
jgi:hypothetical protein